MEYNQIAAAVRLCGTTPKADKCKAECPYYCGPDMMQCIPRMTEDAAQAITDLLARAEAAEAQIEEKEKYYDQMVDAVAANDSEELKETKEKLKEVEDRAEKAEKQRDEYFKHLQGRCFCCGHKSDRFDCHTKCYGHKRGSAWVYAGPEKEE